MFPRALVDDATAVIDACQRAGLKVATAESCTGGLIAAALTEPTGASAVVDRGFIVYANQAKSDLLKVPADLIEANGAVSEPVAAAMVTGALAAAPGVDLAVSVTGVAGPTGGTTAKPVGTVCFGLAKRGRPPTTETRHFDGDRAAVRLETVRHALHLLRATADQAIP